MRALLLDGTVTQNRTLQIVQGFAVNELERKGWSVDTLTLSRLKIAPCMGCFGCWLKTPGVCVINDTGREVAKAIIGSDLLMLLTPVTFGGYSSEIKKALDRMIPLISPYFMKVNGETHHRPRYEKFPDYFGVGVLPSYDTESERIFKRLVERNAINTHSRAYGAAIVTADQDKREIESTVHGLLSGAEVAQ